MPSRLPRIALLAIALLIAPAAALVTHAASPELAFQEESIPAADLSSPGAAGASPAPVSPSPAAASVPNSGDWEALPPSPAVPAAQPSPAAVEFPAQQAPSAPANSPAAEAAATPEPTDVPPAMDAGSMAAAPQVSDASLDAMIKAAPSPERALSMQITEQARRAIEQGRNDDAIRDLAHAVSIDPSNSYAYLYLGRGYRGKKDYTQAVTFLRRAENGLASDPAWLGEAYTFEGQCYEQAGQPAEAAAAYRKALGISPGNLTARVGFTRLSAYAQGPDAGQPTPGPAQPAETIAPLPQEEPPAPAPTD